MTMIERYENYIGSIEENQKALKIELAELSVNDTLTTDERKFMNDLMDFIRYGNTCISVAEHTMKNLKKKEENVENCLRRELGLSVKEEA